ncbi:MAG: YjgN family protein [Telmatospirillum sp.]|nr:YjgN family protein [Telmatospirillum sp.]MDR3439778.1 YjgN family protein [Telmatospirillum sp.]
MDTIPDNDFSIRSNSIYAAEQFRFTGRGSQYFLIWIVNILLTIVTLGVYSAWAKVRRLQYFYRHTELAGSGFDFHGSPIRILIGRVIAIGMLLVYNFAVRVQSPLTLLVIILLAAVMPWLLRNSLRFRLHNSSWRGTRFQFRGTLPGAYRVFLLNLFLTVITLYAMAPFAHQRLKAYQHGNSWFGRTPFSFHARAGRFYRLYLVLLVAMVVFVILAGAAAVGFGGSFPFVPQMQKKRRTHGHARSIPDVYHRVGRPDPGRRHHWADLSCLDDQPDLEQHPPRRTSHRMQYVAARPDLDFFRQFCHDDCDSGTVLSLGHGASGKVPDGVRAAAAGQRFAGIRGVGTRGRWSHRRRSGIDIRFRYRTLERRAPRDLTITNS